MGIGKVRQVELKEVWPHEAQDFTPWLAQNPDELGEQLGLVLEFEREKPVGDFFLDLHGIDQKSGRQVIVENQLGVSDHSHLGQLLTYAGGLGPSIIIWVAKKIRDEHRAALDWLNSQTSSEVSFFGVEVSAIKIDDSPAGPIFDVVVKPNNWSKQISQANSLRRISEKQLQYQAFWEEMLVVLGEEFPELQNKSAQPQSWLPTSTGVSFVNLTLVFTSRGLRVEYYFESPDASTNKSRFDAVINMRTQFESQTNREVVWERLESKKACRISSYGMEEAEVENTDDWPIYRDWFLEAYRDFRRANTQEFMRAIKQAKN